MTNMLAQLPADQKDGVVNLVLPLLKDAGLEDVVQQSTHGDDGSGSSADSGAAASGASPGGAGGGGAAASPGTATSSAGEGGGAYAGSDVSAAGTLLTLCPTGKEGERQDNNDEVVAAFNQLIDTVNKVAHRLQLEAMSTLLSWPSPWKYDELAVQKLNNLKCRAFSAWEPELNCYIDAQKKSAVGFIWFDFDDVSKENIARGSSVALVFIDLEKFIALYDHPMPPKEIPECLHPLQHYLCKKSGNQGTRIIPSAWGNDCGEMHCVDYLLKCVNNFTVWYKHKKDITANIDNAELSATPRVTKTLSFSPTQTSWPLSQSSIPPASTDTLDSDNCETGTQHDDQE
jgi:hypothetical protein